MTYRLVKIGATIEVPENATEEQITEWLHYKLGWNSDPTHEDEKHPLKDVELSADDLSKVSLEFL